MRALLWFATLVALSFAGCLDDAATQEEEKDSTEEPVESAQAPEGFEQSGSVMATVSPGPTVTAVTGESWCAYGCEEIPFTVNETVSAQIVLSWGLEVNDFDLVLMDAEGNEIGMAGESPPATSEQLTVQLAAGDYIIGVVPFAVVADDFTVTVTYA